MNNEVDNVTAGVTSSGQSFKTDQYIIKVSSSEHSSVHFDHRKGSSFN